MPQLQHTALMGARQHDDQTGQHARDFFGVAMPVELRAGRVEQQLVRLQLQLCPALCQPKTLGHLRQQAGFGAAVPGDGQGAGIQLQTAAHIRVVQGLFAPAKRRWLRQLPQLCGAVRIHALRQIAGGQGVAAHLQRMGGQRAGAGKGIVAAVEQRIQ